MQYYRRPADFESRIKSSVADFANCRGPDERHNHPTSVAVELCRLNNQDEWNCVLVFSGVPVDIELSHQSEEYSSAIDPDLELNSFHILTVDSTALVFARLSLRSLARYPESSDSTTPDKLSVRLLACFTKSSFKVRLTGRLRAVAS
jgi:hypothetical protein